MDTAEATTTPPAVNVGSETTPAFGTAIKAVLAARMIDLADIKERLNAELKAASAEYDEVEQRLLDFMKAAGEAKFTTTQGVTFSISARLWARPLPGETDDERQRNRAAVAQALTEEGLDFLVKTDFDIRSLSSFVKETRARGETVPKGLEAVLQIVEDPEIRITGRKTRRA